MTGRILMKTLGVVAIATLLSASADAATKFGSCLHVDSERTPIGTEADPGLRIDAKIENACSASGDFTVEELIAELVIGDDVRDSDDLRDGLAVLSADLYGDDMNESACVRVRGSVSVDGTTFPVAEEECLADDVVVVVRNGRGRGRK